MKEKQPGCKLVVSKETGRRRTITETCPFKRAVVGLLGRKTEQGGHHSQIAHGLGKQNVLYQAYMVGSDRT